MNKHTRRCCVLNCRNSNYTILSKTKTKLFKFPRNGNRCRDWLRVIGDPGVASCTWETLITHGYVCRDHFEEKYVTANQGITVNAVPTIFPDLRTPLSDSQLRLFNESVPVQKSLLGFDCYERVGSHAKNPTTNQNSIMNNMVVEAESIIKLEEVNFELLRGVKIGSHVEEPIMNQNPIMGDIVVEAESIIKLEEIKEEPNDNVDESPWNFLGEGQPPLPLMEPKEEVAEKAQEKEVQPPLPLPWPWPLLEPKEEVAEIKQEEEDEVQPPFPLLEPIEEVAEIKQEEEDEVQLPFPLLEPIEEVAEIKQEEEVGELEPLAAVFIQCGTDETEELEPPAAVFIKCGIDETEAKGEELEPPAAVFIKCGIDETEAKGEELEPPAAVFIKCGIDETEAKGEKLEPPAAVLIKCGTDETEAKGEELVAPAADFIKCGTDETVAEGEGPFAAFNEDDSIDSSMQKRRYLCPIEGVFKLAEDDETSEQTTPKNLSASSSEDDDRDIHDDHNDHDDRDNHDDEKKEDEEGASEDALKTFVLDAPSRMPQCESLVKCGEEELALSVLAKRPKLMLQDASSRMQKTHWSASVRKRVVELALSGECSVAAAGRQFGVPSATARRWMHEWLMTGNVQRREGTGRWRISSSEEDALVLSAARSFPFLRSTHLKHVLAFPGSTSTLLRRLRDAGLGAEWFPNLMDGQRVDRVAFALDNAHRDWGLVVFSSACVFSAGGGGPVRVLRPQVTQHNAGYVPEPPGCGRASVACWGWVSARGVGVVQRIEPAPLAAQYLHILENVMLPSARVLYPEGPFFFQQDQHRVHKTDFVQEWLASQREFELLDWPPCSADLNPMEDVWAKTKQEMADKWPSPQPETSDALWELVADAWDAVASEEDFAAQLVRSLPRRMRQVVEMEGYWVAF